MFIDLQRKIILDDVGEYATAYLDNVVIYSRTWDDNLRHINEIFDMLSKAGLTVKQKQCQFAMSSCAYLEHIVGNDKVHPEQEKVKAAHYFPTPRTK